MIAFQTNIFWALTDSYKNAILTLVTGKNPTTALYSETTKAENNAKTLKRSEQYWNNTELQFKDTKFAIKNKLIDLLT